MYYTIFGLYVKSDYKFEEVVEIQSVAQIDVIIKEAKLPLTIIEEMEEIEKEANRGMVNIFHCERNIGWFRWHGYGSFLITNGTKIEYQLEPDVDKLFVNELFLCLAFFYILYQRGLISMHGSGLVWGDKTIIVSGQSGSGKSSLAEAILKEGAKFLADDTVAVSIDENGIYAKPAYPQQKLCLDQITEEMRQNYNMVLLPEDGGVIKYGVRMLDRFCSVPKKLDALVILRKDDTIKEPMILEINGSDKIKYLIQNLYKYDTYIRAGLGTDVFKKSVQMANEIKIFLVSRPSVGMTVDKQLELVKKALDI